jgi:hypothetical protein
LISGSRRTIAERSANAFPSKRLTGKKIGGQVWVGEYHPTQPNKINVSPSDFVLRDIGQELL